MRSETFLVRRRVPVLLGWILTVAACAPARTISGPGAPPPRFGDQSGDPFSEEVRRDPDPAAKIARLPLTPDERAEILSAEPEEPSTRVELFTGNEDEEDEGPPVPDGPTAEPAPVHPDAPTAPPGDAEGRGEVVEGSGGALGGATADATDGDATLPERIERTQAGLGYRVLRPGDGPAVGEGDAEIVARYRVWSADGRLVEGEVARSLIATFPLHRFSRGWTEALGAMRVGQVTRFWIPASLSLQGTPDVPEGPLIVDVELLEVRTGG